MTAKRYKTETTAREFAIRYCISSTESLKFVQDIRAEIKKMNRPDEVQNLNEEFLINLTKQTFVPFSMRQFRLGEKLILFSYQTINFENYIHPLISHF